MPLSSARIRELDGIVLNAQKMKMPLDVIKKVVDDFKAMYDESGSVNDMGALRAEQEETPQTMQDFRATTDEGTFKQRLGFDGGTPEQKTLFGLDRETEDKVFPSLKNMNPADLKQAIKRPISGGALSLAGDLVSTPSRFVAQAVTNPKTGEKFKMSEEDAMLLRQPTDWLKGKVKDTGIVGDIAKAGIEVAGNTLSDPLLLAGFAKGLSKVLPKNVVGRTLKHTTGISDDYLRMLGKKETRQALVEAFNTEPKIAKKLVEDVIDDAGKYLNKNEDVVKEAFKTAKDIDMSKMTSKIKSIADDIPSGTKEAISVKETIKEIADNFDDFAIGKGISKRLETGKALKNIDPYAPKNVRPIEFRKLRKQLDGTLKAAYKKDNMDISLLQEETKKIRGIMKETLENAADEKYKKAMADYSDEISALDDLKEYAGRDKRTKRVDNLQGAIEKAYPKNKENFKDIIKNIDKITGKDISSEMKMAYIAKQLGSEGRGSFVPGWAKNKSIPEKAIAMMIGSPRIAGRAVLPATDFSGKLTGRAIDALKYYKGAPAIGGILTRTKE